MKKEVQHKNKKTKLKSKEKIKLETNIPGQNNNLGTEIATSEASKNNFLFRW